MILGVAFNTSAFRASVRDGIAELQEVLVEELLVSAGDVVEEMRTSWPRRTGRSADGFDVTPISGGARIDNPVPYVPYVHRRGEPALALDTVTGPALERAIQQIPERAAASAARRLT